MSDPLRTDPSRVSDSAPAADRDAKIEQLLLQGLDHYLSARYEEAINVWTRALFLDRSHARARAYIERARSALAERQRESEELLQHGVDAFDRGEAEEARRLLREAINQGAPSEEALAILDRLNRLDHGASAAPALPLWKRARPLQAAEEKRGSSRVAWAAVVGLSFVILAAGAFGAGAFRSDWRALLERPRPPLSNPAGQFGPDERPPLPRRGEIALTRARTLASGGRLRDALTALDQVEATDPEKADADRLRTEVQKQLIELADVR